MTSNPTPTPSADTIETAHQWLRCRKSGAFPHCLTHDLWEIDDDLIRAASDLWPCPVAVDLAAYIEDRDRARDADLIERLDYAEKAEAEVARLTALVQSTEDKADDNLAEIESAHAERDALAAQVAHLAEPGDPDARMDAYYYGFTRTGIGVVDNILSAVAKAGKSYHGTDMWGEELFGGGTCESRIQDAADAAAEQIRAAERLDTAAGERPEFETQRLLGKAAGVRLAVSYVQDRQAQESQ